MLASLACSLVETTNDIEGVITRAHHSLRRPNRVTNVRELATIEAESLRLLCQITRVVLAEVRVLDVFLKVGNQELLAVASFCCAQPLNRGGALSTMANREDAAVGGKPRAFDFCVEYKVNRM